MREPVALKHGWVRSAPHPELPSPDFCLEKVERKRLDLDVR